MKKFVDGVIVDMTDEEIAARQAEEKEWADGAAARNLSSLREERNRLLAETDWLIVMHKEKGTNIPTAWKTYRQELRDITNDYTSLNDVVWPEKP
tara:strand:+ start:478 stop:762 length:285 start_codon:yes stop_codon:yes gene_type:complete